MCEKGFNVFESVISSGKNTIITANPGIGVITDLHELAKKHNKVCVDIRLPHLSYDEIEQTFHKLISEADIVILSDFSSLNEKSQKLVKELIKNINKQIIVVSYFIEEKIPDVTEFLKISIKDLYL